MTFNTGNPVGSVDPRDLYDNAENLDIAANSEEPTFKDRLGKTRLTLKGMEEAASTGNPAIQAAADAYHSAEVAKAEVAKVPVIVDTAITNATSAAVSSAALQAQRAEAAADVATMATAIYASTTAGLAATTSGQYFSVPAAASAESLILYRNNSGSAVEVKRYPSSSINSLVVNSGKVYPFKATTRAGILSPEKPDWSNTILDVKIIGARAGELYQVAYQQNEVLIGGTTLFNWIIKAFPSDTFSTTGAGEVVLISLSDTVPQITRNGGIQTVNLVPPGRPEMVISITIDAAKLPAAGTPLNSNSSGGTGWSWTVDPSCYYRIAGGVSAATGNSPVYFVYTHAAKRVSYAYRSGRYYYRVTFGKNGYNELPNLISIERAALVADIRDASFVMLSTATTDYLPPMVFRAVNNGDPSATSIYTGGNHGADGNDGGGQTARNTLFAVYADGVLINANAAGFADSLDIQVVNELMAWNTIAYSRYALRQTFGIMASARGLEVSAHIRAIEDIIISTDNGPQCYFGGFSTSQLMLDSANTSRVPLDTTISSGPKASYPNAWAIVMKSSNGLMACWMDRNYEAGDGRYVDASASYIRGPGAGRAKFYHAAVAAYNLTLGAGQSYRWRGGYHFCDDLPQTGFDSNFSITLGRRAAVVAALEGGESIIA